MDRTEWKMKIPFYQLVQAQERFETNIFDVARCFIGTFFN